MNYKKKWGAFKTLAFGLISLSIVSCSNDDSSDFTLFGDATRTFSFENVTPIKNFNESGSFYGQGSTATQNQLILPGESVSFSFSAANKQALAFVTMYGNSKDWFFAPENPGLQLFDASGNAITGDVSNQIKLWDNGTKDDVSGNPENNPIAPVPNIDASTLMKLELEYTPVSSVFKLTITNTSGNTSFSTPFSPGVWAVSNFDEVNLYASAPFFVAGQPSTPELTNIAQGGAIAALLDKVTLNTGIMTNISQFVVVEYTGDVNPIYTLGQADKGIGLKGLSQFGDAASFAANLVNVPGVIHVYTTADGLMPGDKQDLKLEIKHNSKIALAAMFAYSNDWFFTNTQKITNITLGNVSSGVQILDSGTGVSQYPGAGNHQAIFGGTPEAENLPIAVVSATENSNLKSADHYLKVTIF